MNIALHLSSEQSSIVRGELCFVYAKGSKGMVVHNIVVTEAESPRVS